jgi:L-lysine 4-chlorinase
VKDLIKEADTHLKDMAKNKVLLEEKACTFLKQGFVRMNGFIPTSVIDAVREDAIRIADKYSTHWKTNLSTTGYTPRDMDVVMSEDISKNSELISTIYRLPSLRNVLNHVSHAKVYDMPEVNEELFLSRHHKAGNTHGWHWGDYSYALVWVLVAPPIDAGGSLQCVPHTRWDKEDRNVVNKYLEENKISTFHFKSGDLYYLKADTTMHRTIPLTQDKLRVMLNMSWAGYLNANKTMNGIEWWQQKDFGKEESTKYKPLGAVEK